VERAIERFLSTWDNPETIDRKVDVWTKGANFGGVRERGVKILRSYHEYTELDDRTVLAAEHHFLVPLGEFELHGFVDLVETRKNKHGQQEISIVDYKTNKKTPYINQLAQNLQFTAYAYAASQPEFWTGHGTEEFPALCDHEFWQKHIAGLTIRPVWYHLETSKRIDCGIRDHNDFLRLHRVAQMIERAMRLEVYVPNISGDSCTFCPYKEPCGLPLHEVDPDA
jgi:CRISPR/Cas system-associated exonuclease Cas4 (RecB family)